jgi:hypothetical protein
MDWTLHSPPRSYIVGTYVAQSECRSVNHSQRPEENKNPRDGLRRASRITARASRSDRNWRRDGPNDFMQMTYDCPSSHTVWLYCRKDY